MKFKRKIKYIFGLFLVLFLLSCPVLAQEQNTFPSSYDLRDLNGQSYVTPVKNQGSLGTCWAHSATGCAETNALLKGGSTNVNFSEKSLAWFCYQFQGPPSATEEELEGIYSWKFDISNMPEGYDDLTNVYNNGGNTRTAPNQLSTWLGASTEEQIPYMNSAGDFNESNGQMIPSKLGDWTLDYYGIYNNAFHLQNSQIIDGTAIGASVEEYVPKTKELMLESGALCVGYHALKSGKKSDYFNDATFAQYIPPEANQDPNHSVMIVGWDDNYSQSNFKTQPPGDGAWIIKNSWGPNWGDAGYFYLSYYDSTIDYLNSVDVETPELGYSYDKNYQYDYTGDKDGNTTQMIDRWINALTENESNLTPDKYAFANIFTAEGNEFLEAVSAYTVMPNAQVTAKIYLLDEDYNNPEDGELVATVTSNLENYGFYTLELDKPITLNPGQKFSVVENIVYTVTNSKEPVKIPAISVEYGLENPTIGFLIDDEGQEIGLSTKNIVANIQKGESYVYGISGNLNEPSDSWSDITDPKTFSDLSFDTTITIGNQDYPNVFVPGNCMIKAYTSVNDPEANLPTGIEFDPYTLCLTTDITGITSADLAAILIPSNATGDISYYVEPPSVARVSQSGNTATVTAVSEGRATLVARTVNGYVATKDILVNNNKFIIEDGVTVETSDQDYMSFKINDLIPNPAFDDNVSVSSVSFFIWSSPDLSDVQVQEGIKIPGTDSWTTTPFGINTTNKYLLNADDIKYIVYVGDERNALDNMVFTGFTSWVNPGVEEEGNVSYISYNQNVGFVLPTVHEGSSGEINNPDSVHMEGLRISSGIPDVNVITTVHAADIGWMDPVDDGSYAGTMHENRALEAIQLDQASTLDNYMLTYRVYIRGQGWTGWVSEGEVAGTTGQGLPIQAVDIKIVPI